MFGRSRQREVAHYDEQRATAEDLGAYGSADATVATGHGDERADAGDRATREPRHDPVSPAGTGQGRRGRRARLEGSGDRLALARDAGMGRVSPGSVIAGTLVAYGAFAVLVAVAASLAAAFGSTTNLSANQWRQYGAGGGAVIATLLLVAYLFGGYVAGRMARRSGVTNGILVFLLGLAIAVGVGALARLSGGATAVTDGLRNVGAPTTWHEWRDIGTVAGIGSLLAMLIGSLAGGAIGERWHTKLLTRALDPTIGPEARLRQESAERLDDAQRRHTAAEGRVARTRGLGSEPAWAGEPADRPAAEGRRRDRLDPASGDRLDPANGDRLDPANGDRLDPANGDRLDPASGDRLDPATGRDHRVVAGPAAMEGERGIRQNDRADPNLGGDVMSATGGSRRWWQR